MELREMKLSLVIRWRRQARNKCVLCKKTRLHTTEIAKMADRYSIYHFTTTDAAKSEATKAADAEESNVVQILIQ